MFELSLTDEETNRRGSGSSEEEEAAQTEKCHPCEWLTSFDQEWGTSDFAKLQ